MTFGSMTSAPYDSGLSKQTAGKSLGGLLCPTRDMDLAGPCSHSPSPGGIFPWSAQSVSVWLVSSVSQCVAGQSSQSVCGWLVQTVSVWLVSPVSQRGGWSFQSSQWVAGQSSQCVAGQSSQSMGGWSVQSGWSSGKSLLMQELMQPATPLPHPPTISTLAHAPLT